VKRSRKREAEGGKKGGAFYLPCLFLSHSFNLVLTPRFCGLNHKLVAFAGSVLVLEAFAGPLPALEALAGSGGSCWLFAGSWLVLALAPPPSPSPRDL